MSAVVYVLTAWNERTDEDVVRVFADKAAADKAVDAVKDAASGLVARGGVGITA